MRITVLAHLVQHSADTGELPAKQTLALARRDLPRDAKHAFVPQLRLLGAVARLESFCGNPVRALERQRQLAECHLQNLGYEDVSLPLCEWFRMAGALADAPALGAAEALYEEAQALGVFTAADLGYLALARARASVQAGEPKAEALGELRRLAEDATVADHVRRSAARWAVACARALGDGGGVAAAQAVLASACPEGDRDARAYASLASLDAALAAGDAEAAAAAVGMLRECQPGLLAHLTDEREPGDVAAHVARFFPY